MAASSTLIVRSKIGFGLEHDGDVLAGVLRPHFEVCFADHRCDERFAGLTHSTAWLIER
jgi:hypothetical protein